MTTEGGPNLALVFHLWVEADRTGIWRSGGRCLSSIVVVGDVDDFPF